MFLQSTYEPKKSLAPGKELRYSINGRLGGSESCYGHFGEQKNLLYRQRLQDFHQP